MLTLADDIVGKTIVSMVSDSDGGEIVFVFTDGTYCHFTGVSGRGTGLTVDSGLALRAGVFTQEEADAWRSERQNERLLQERVGALVTTIRVLRAERVPCKRHVDELQKIIDNVSLNLNQRIQLTAFIADS